jgi:hypothetical protein
MPDRPPASFVSLENLLPVEPIVRRAKQIHTAPPAHSDICLDSITAFVCCDEQSRFLERIKNRVSTMSNDPATAVRKRFAPWMLVALALLGTGMFSGCHVQCCRKFVEFECEVKLGRPWRHRPCRPLAACVYASPSHAPGDQAVGATSNSKQTTSSTQSLMSDVTHRAADASESADDHDSASRFPQFSLPEFPRAGEITGRQFTPTSQDLDEPLGLGDEVESETDSANPLTDWNRDTSHRRPAVSVEPSSQSILIRDDTAPTTPPESPDHQSSNTIVVEIDSADADETHEESWEPNTAPPEDPESSSHGVDSESTQFLNSLSQLAVHDPSFMLGELPATEAGLAQRIRLTAIPKLESHFTLPPIVRVRSAPLGSGEEATPGYQILISPLATEIDRQPIDTRLEEQRVGRRLEEPNTLRR